MAEDKQIALPEAFLQEAKKLFSAEEYARFVSALDSSAPVSLRLNKAKAGAELGHLPLSQGVPWCASGQYLSERPVFALDPAWHQGAYYVQEAASMYLEQAVLRILEEDTGPFFALDLCAAPGGKASHLISLLPSGSVVLANEYINTRKQVLSENLYKWGQGCFAVSNYSPQQLAKKEAWADILVADLPCSGEGLFRKSPASRCEWSPENVALCQRRSREILDAAWKILQPGGWLVLSTCTYNTSENEEQVEYLQKSYGAESYALADFGQQSSRGDMHCYRFYPHRDKSEGFFLALLRKPGQRQALDTGRKKKKQKGERGLELPEQVQNWLTESDYERIFLEDHNGDICFWPKAYFGHWKLLQSYVPFSDIGTVFASPLKKGDYKPHPFFSHSSALRQEAFSCIDLEKEEALALLRLQNKTLDSPQRGWQLLRFGGLALAWAKHLGNRTNYYYPTHWKLRMDS